MQLICFDMSSQGNITIQTGDGCGPPIQNFNYVKFAKQILKQKSSKPVIGTFAETFKQLLADQNVSSPSEQIEKRVRSFSTGTFLGIQVIQKVLALHLVIIRIIPNSQE
jgi:hypothetical protein